MIRQHQIRNPPTGDDVRTGVTVVICCNNSREVLPETLRHMAKQEMPNGVGWEVILVDNASTDGTREMAQEFWKNLKTEIEFRCVRETKPGLNFARKKGVYSAKYPILVFCDDDNWFPPNYVASVFRIMMANPEFGICGGEAVAVTDGAFPDWFENYKSAYAVGNQGRKGGLVKSRLYGAGLTVRRDVLKKACDLGFVTLLSDRQGSSLASGGDGELAEWVLMLGYDKWYFDPTLRFQHFIKQSRLTRPHLVKVYKGFGEASPILATYGYLRSRNCSATFLWCRCVASSLVALFRNTVLRGGSLGGRKLAYKRHSASLRWLLAHPLEYRDKVAKIREMKKLARVEATARLPNE